MATSKEAVAKYYAKITRVQVNLNPENLSTQLKQLIREAVVIRNALGKK